MTCPNPPIISYVPTHICGRQNWQRHIVAIFFSSSTADLEDFHICFKGKAVLSSRSSGSDQSRVEGWLSAPRCDPWHPSNHKSLYSYFFMSKFHDDYHFHFSTKLNPRAKRDISTNLNRTSFLCYCAQCFPEGGDFYIMQSVSKSRNFS